MINAKDTVIFSIGGQIFVTRRANLYRLPESRLYMLAVQNKNGDDDDDDTKTVDSTSKHHLDISSPAIDQMNKQPIYFFDRDPEIFRFVLDYYRTGELHLPSGICGPFVRKELIFWGIDESYILPCCMPAYMRYEEERRTKRTLFRDCFEDLDSIKNLLQCCRGFKKWRYQAWLFLEHPGSSLTAKCWALLLLVLMIASVMCFCLSTHELFRQPFNQCIDESIPKRNSTLDYFFNSTLCSSDQMKRNPKLRKDCTTQPAWKLVYSDIALNALFTTEYFIKIILAPDKKKFVKSLISQLDIVILFSYWMYISVFYYHSYQQTHTFMPNYGSGSVRLWLMNILSMSQVLRILRIFRISKISRGLQVLILTVKKSIPELVLLAFLLMNGMFLFSALIYIAEYQQHDTFPDIPHGFWWSIITLTTVGYGDFYPKSGYGYLIGSVAAISGCIVTGLAIPIIGNNFNTYYKYMQNQLKEDKYIKQLRKDLNESVPSSSKSYGTSPGIFKDYLIHKPKRKIFRSTRSDIEEHTTPNGKINRLRQKNTSPGSCNDSFFSRNLPKLRLNRAKTFQSSPSLLRNDNSTATESTELLSPFKKLKTNSVKLYSDQFETIEMSQNLSCLSDDLIAKRQLILSSHETIVDHAFIVSDVDKIIVSPDIEKTKQMTLRTNILGDYV